MISVERLVKRYKRYCILTVTVDFTSHVLGNPCEYIFVVLENGDQIGTKGFFEARTNLNFLCRVSEWDKHNFFGGSGSLNTIISNMVIAFIIFVQDPLPFNVRTLAFFTVK